QPAATADAPSQKARADGSPVPAFMPDKVANDGMAHFTRAGPDGSAPSATAADDDTQGPLPSRRAHAKESPRGSEPAGRDPSDRRTANTVTVTHERSFPAPAAHAMSPAASRIVEALAAGARPVPQAPVPASSAPAAVALPTHILKI